MKPQVVGSACFRVQEALDESLSEGTLTLPAELAAHAVRCPRCGPEVAQTEELLSRLRGAAATIGLGILPSVVDHVMSETVAWSLPAGIRAPEPAMQSPTQPRTHTRWVLGQVAAVAAVLVVTTSLVTYSMLKINEAVSGVKPGEVLAHLVTPFQNMNTAELRNSK